MTRKTGILIGLAIMGLAVLAFAFLKNNSDSEERTGEGQQPPRTVVDFVTVALDSLPYRIEATGTLKAKESIELFSEVQGILLREKTRFKTGNSFYKGQTLVAIDGSEFLAQLKSNKSSLVNQIAAMLPDMEVEFPQAFKKWEVYLRNFDDNGALPPLPKPTSDAEKFFVLGKNIEQTYYSVQNQQEKLYKYTIRAPFTGILSEANVNVGALVRIGQKLGTFIDPSMYELKLSIPASDNTYIRLGRKVELVIPDSDGIYPGKISRISPSINQETQSIEAYVEVSGNGLKDGQYLRAIIKGAPIGEVFQISSDLITTNQSVFTVEEGKLKLAKVTPQYYVGDSVVVKGLTDGQLLVTGKLANAYPGMPVETTKR